MNKFFSWVVGLGIGAGAMYFMDPDRGKKRRTLVRDQAVRMVNRSDDAINTAMADLRNRMQGVSARVSSILNENPMISNTPPEPVRGAGVGEGTGTTYWNPTARLAAGVGGGLLWIYGVSRKGLIGTVASAAGLGLAVRGITNSPLENLIGMGTKQQGVIDVNKSMVVDAPVHDVYEYWENFENFPKFMEHLESVTNKENGLSHWVAKGPAGVNVEWDAMTIADVPDKEISWESVPGSQIMTRGSVKFRPSDGMTQINVHMNYSPPGGVLGHAVAKLFGNDPKQAMDEDMNRLKTLLEKGKTTKSGTEVFPEDVKPQ